MISQFRGYTCDLVVDGQSLGRIRIEGEMLREERGNKSGLGGVEILRGHRIAHRGRSCFVRLAVDGAAANPAPGGNRGEAPGPMQAAGRSLGLDDRRAPEFAATQSRLGTDWGQTDHSHISDSLFARMPPISTRAAS